MKPTKAFILVVNAGSSSLKFALYERALTLLEIFKGSFEGIGASCASLKIKSSTDADTFINFNKPLDHRAATLHLIDWLNERVHASELIAIGYRIVHGGSNFDEPTEVTSQVLREIRKLSTIDPDHAPLELELIEKFKQVFASVPQWACFDTSFHRNLPLVSRLLPIPLRYEEKGIRRYGFHGISFEYLMSEFVRIASDQREHRRVIIAHLGSGVSLAAVSHGKSIDTTMSFTPNSGVPMATRSGDLDPSLFSYLSTTEGMTDQAFNKMVCLESGLLGLSETSADMRELLEAEKTDHRAADAVALFCYHIKKTIGAYAAVLGGVDTLIFSGGIGENSPEIRERICKGLDFLGIALDEQENRSGSQVISESGGRARVRVIRTDEERQIAETVSDKFRTGT